MSLDRNLRDPNKVFPFPIPKRDPDTWGITYAPVIGNTMRRFRTMNDACDYQVGARARILNMGLHGEAPQNTLQGWADQDRLIAEREHAAKEAAGQKTTFVEYVAERGRQRVKTMDQMLKECTQ
jgi:hypothetical protein